MTLLTAIERKAAQAAINEILAGETDHLTTSMERAMHSARSKLQTRSLTATPLLDRLTAKEATAFYEALSFVIENCSCDLPCKRCHPLFKLRAQL